MKSDPTIGFAKRDSLSETHLAAIVPHETIDAEVMWANLEIVDDDKLQAQLKLSTTRSLPQELTASVRDTLRDLKLTTQKAQKQTTQREQVPPWGVCGETRRIVQDAMRELHPSDSYSNNLRRRSFKCSSDDTESEAVVFNGMCWMPTLYEEETGDLETIAREIFNTYCARGAPQEINAGDQQRLTELFSRDYLDEGDLYHVFDKAFKVVVQLLTNDSLMRFRTSLPAFLRAASEPMRSKMPERPPTINARRATHMA